MEEKKRRKIVEGLCGLVFLGCMFYLFERLDVSVSDLLKYQPQNKFLASLVFIGFYALKSLTVFLPVPMLYLAVGHLFSTGVAIVVNFVGIAVAVSVPYWIGKYRFQGKMEEKMDEKKLVSKINSILSERTWFSVYMIRMMQLPMDLVSCYLGSKKLPYGEYVLGSLLGMAPSMIGITVIGNNITHPTSPVFVQSCIFMVSMIVLSFLVFHATRKKHVK